MLLSGRPVRDLWKVCCCRGLPKLVERKKSKVYESPQDECNEYKEESKKVRWGYGIITQVLSLMENRTKSGEGLESECLWKGECSDD